MTRAEIVTQTVMQELAKPYTYGKSDCFFMGMRVVDAVRGTKHCKTYAKDYRTLAGAQRALRKRGHKSLTTFFAEHLEQIPAGQCVLGDLVVAERQGAEHVAVCTGTGFVGKTESGSTPFPISEIKAAFKV